LKSLRARLLVALYLAVLLLWLLTGAASHLQAYHEAGEMLDGQLAQAARLIIAHTLQELKEGEGEDDVFTESMAFPAIHPYEQPMQFQVWLPDGRLLLRAKDAPLRPLATAVGYSDIRQSDRIWRTLTLWEPGMRFQVQVAQPAEEREKVAMDVSRRVLLPTLLALPFLSMLIYVTVRRSMRPLEALAASVGKRTPDNLRPLGGDAAPEEVRPLIEALNRLLLRLGNTLENERRFTADAAHELRTPLAALKVQAQVALASTDEASRRHALINTVAGADRATRLIEQLLRLARLDTVGGLAETRQVNLDRLLTESANDMADQARRKGVELSIAGSDRQHHVAGDADMLRLALRNLMENAIRYTPQGGTVQTGISHQNGALRLWVRDTGPGVSAAELPHLTERFYRSPDAASEGSGLGLAIALCIAELHGATLEIGNRPEGGLQADLVWRVPPG
jgi:two-component system, OmpR family, sensor histidine kinase QseC